MPSNLQIAVVSLVSATIGGCISFGATYFTTRVQRQERREDHLASKQAQERERLLAFLDAAGELVGEALRAQALRTAAGAMPPEGWVPSIGLRTRADIALVRAGNDPGLLRLLHELDQAVTVAIGDLEPGERTARLTEVGHRSGTLIAAVDALVNT